MDLGYSAVPKDFGSSICGSTRTSVPFANSSATKNAGTSVLFASQLSTRLKPVASSFCD